MLTIVERIKIIKALLQNCSFIQYIVVYFEYLTVYCMIIAFCNNFFITEKVLNKIEHICCQVLDSI